VYAEEFIDASDDEIITHVLNQLDSFFDGQASKYYTKHYIKNWSTEPYIEGAYSKAWVNYDWTLEQLSKSVEQKLYFCGEHTDSIEVATVHGAALSGRRAAQQLLLDVPGIGSK
jgi:monoamine oxidase